MSVYILLGVLLGAIYGLLDRDWSTLDEKILSWLKARGRAGIYVARVYLRIRKFILLTKVLILQVRATTSSYIFFAIKKVYEVPHVRIFLWAGLYYFAFWFIPKVPTSVSVPMLDYFFNQIGIFSSNDKYILNLIKMCTTFLQILLPLSLTFYTFTYREQKSVSESISTNSNRKIPILIFIEIGIFTILYGIHLSFIFDQSSRGIFSDRPEIAHSITNFSRLVVLFISFSISVYFGIVTVINLLRNINIKWLLDNSIKITDSNFEKLILSLHYRFFKKTRKKIYDNLYLDIESIYQMLSLSIEKNMDHVFSVYYSKWINIFLKFQSRLILFNSKGAAIRYLGPLTKDPEEFTLMYKAILKNHLSLIMTLCKKHKVEEALDCMKTLFNLNPREDELEMVYLKTLSELSVFLYENDTIGLRPFLRELESYTKEVDENQKKGIVLIYEDLIIRVIKNNDVRLLTSLCYSFSQIGGEIKSKKKNVKYMIKSYTKEKGNTDYNTIECSCIFVLLQATLKSIELSYYSLTGFLVKFMVTNFNSESLREVFKTFIKEAVSHNNPYLHGAEVYLSFNGWFFNNKSLQYCLKKLAILIYGQQKYVIKNGMDFGYIPKKFIDIKVLKCSYIDYLFSKVSKAESKYGLLYLDDPDFMNSLKDDIIMELRLKH